MSTKNTSCRQKIQLETKIKLYVNEKTILFLQKISHQQLYMLSTKVTTSCRQSTENTTCRQK
jgi:hypothetical protein